VASDKVSNTDTVTAFKVQATIPRLLIERTYQLRLFWPTPPVCTPGLDAARSRLNKIADAKSRLLAAKILAQSAEPATCPSPRASLPWIDGRSRVSSTQLCEPAAAIPIAGLGQTLPSSPGD